MNVMISLVGEQPAPNLLPTRHLKPDIAVLVCTDRTRRVAENLKSLLKCRCETCLVHPYSIHEIQEKLSSFLESRFPESSFIFNLTGGTKPMALAAFQLAKRYGSPSVYFQTEGNRSLLYQYAFEGAKFALKAVEGLPTTISLDDYLRMYLGTYTCGEPRNDFERQVVEVLRSTPEIDEVFTSLRPQGMEALEVDFIVRCGNQVGIGEVKVKGKKDGIDQLNAVAEQRYLGTYVKKFLISGKPVHPNNKNLAKAYKIRIIELLSFGETSELNTDDKCKLIDTVIRSLGGPRCSSSTSPTP